MGNACCTGNRVPPDTPQDHKSAEKFIERMSISSLGEIKTIPRTSLRRTIIVLPNQEESNDDEDLKSSESPEAMSPSSNTYVEP